MMSESAFIKYIESGFCVFKAPIELLTNALLDWQNTVLKPYGANLTSTCASGSIDDLIVEMTPRVSPVRTKIMSISCKNGWVMVLDNGLHGTDAGLAKVLSRKCGCISLRVVSKPDIAFLEGCGSFGAEIFESFDHGVPVRTIYCANDGGKWKFGQSGTPYPFENTHIYDNKKIKDRFTHEGIVNILAHLNIHAFDESWYATDGNAVATIYTRSDLLSEAIRRGQAGMALS